MAEAVGKVGRTTKAHDLCISFPIACAMRFIIFLFCYRVHGALFISHAYPPFRLRLQGGLTSERAYGAGLNSYQNQVVSA